MSSLVSSPKPFKNPTSAALLSLTKLIAVFISLTTKGPEKLLYTVRHSVLWLDSDFIVLILSLLICTTIPYLRSNLFWILFPSSSNFAQYVPDFSVRMCEIYVSSYLFLPFPLLFRIVQSFNKFVGSFCDIFFTKTCRNISFYRYIEHVSEPCIAFPSWQEFISHWHPYQPSIYPSSLSKIPYGLL